MHLPLHHDLAQLQRDLHQIKVDPRVPETHKVDEYLARVDAANSQLRQNASPYQYWIEPDLRVSVRRNLPDQFQSRPNMGKPSPYPVKKPKKRWGVLDGVVQGTIETVGQVLTLPFYLLGG